MKSYKKHIVCFGESLWDMLPSKALPGGAPMNVALQLKNLGTKVSFISRVGKDNLGEQLLEYINRKTVSTQWIQLDDKHPTGQVNVDITNREEVKYDIASSAAWDYIDWTPDMLDLMNNADAIVYGSLACRNETSMKTLCKLLNIAPLKIFDVNLRTPHDKQEIIAELIARSHIVKVNEEELRIVANWFTNHQDSLSSLHYLRKQFNLRAILMTRSAQGAWLLDDTGLYKQPGFNVSVADTIGSGDAFLAAMTKKVLEKAKPQCALAYACAVGALVASCKGANHTFTEKRINEILQI